MGQADWIQAGGLTPIFLLFQSWRSEDETEHTELA